MLDVLDWSKNWDHQNRCHLAMDAAQASGKRAVVAAAPPGAGKSRVMFQRAHRELERGGYVLLGVHRSLLLQQMVGYAENMGLPYGVIEAGTKPDLSKRFQVASIPTLYSWVVKRGSLDMPPATLAIWDEAHANTKDQTRSLFYGAHDGITRIQGLIDRGAVVEGYTGSPVNLGGLYDELVVCGTYKELRAVKSHAMVAVYGPEEIDVEDLKLDDEGEYSSKKLEPRAFAIWGSVYDWWQKLNPFALPALLFGPSAPGARWFALEFIKRGVTAGYIGADCVMLPGHLPCGTLCLDTYPSTTETRGQALELSRTGGIKVLCNRFVLREAIDMPWIKHGIAATVFGGLATYLQSVGRVQRYFAAYGDEPKIWQCHGGSFWRHGSPNAERHWWLGCTNRDLAKLRKERVEKAPDAQQVEGIQCPRCHGWRTSGPQCPHCNHMHKRSVRYVRQVDGALVKMQGAATKVKKKKQLTEQSIWNGVLYGSVTIDRPVSSAVAMFYARAKAAGIQHPNVQGLVNPPPMRDTKAWHSLVKDVYPDVKPRRNA